MLPQAHGKVMFCGTDISRWPSHRVCDLGLGQVAEGRQIFPTLSVAENLDIGAMLPRARAQRKRNRERVLAMFPKLAERAHQPAGTLSGGEQQMLAIGRCLMGAPQFVMFDEPSLGLAPVIVRNVLAIIRELNAEGITCLLVEQNGAVAQTRGPRLRSGKRAGDIIRKRQRTSRRRSRTQSLFGSVAGGWQSDQPADGY